MVFAMSTIKPIMCSGTEINANNNSAKEKNTVAVPNEKPKPKPKPPPSYLQFAETINGRCAMQGFMWGSIREISTNKGVFDQLIDQRPYGGFDIVPDSVLYAISVIALVTLGTAITTLNPNELTEKSMKYKPEAFNENAELINGRAAMVGFLILSMINP